MAAAAVTGVVVAGGDGNDGHADADDEAASSAERASTTDRPTTTTALTTTTTAPPQWQQAAAPDGTFRFELPGEWRYAPPAADPSAVGTQMFPDDPVAATSVEPIASALTTPETKLLALDGSQVLGGIPDVVIIDSQSGLPTLDYPEVVSAARQFPGQATVGADGRMSSVVGEIAWIDLSIPSIGMDGVRYFVIDGDELWLLTFWSDEMPAMRPTADRIAASFDPR
ncbi:MAG: hypothetical protein ACRDZN_09805 [Acidimicrobiales bacterium]